MADAVQIDLSNDKLQRTWLHPEKKPVIRKARKQESKNHIEDEHRMDDCICCNGYGEHDTGYECYRCDASGLESDAIGDVPCGGRSDSNELELIDGRYEHKNAGGNPNHDKLGRFAETGAGHIAPSLHSYNETATKLANQRNEARSKMREIQQKQSGIDSNSPEFKALDTEYEKLNNSMYSLGDQARKNREAVKEDLDGYFAANGVDAKSLSAKVGEWGGGEWMGILKKEKKPTVDLFTDTELKAMRKLNTALHPEGVEAYRGIRLDKGSDSYTVGAKELSSFTTDKKTADRYSDLHALESEKSTYILTEKLSPKNIVMSGSWAGVYGPQMEGQAEIVVNFGKDTTYQVSSKKMVSINAKGGNPYHDQLGRFTTGSFPTDINGFGDFGDLRKQDADYYRADPMERLTDKLGYNELPHQEDGIPDTEQTLHRSWGTADYVKSYASEPTPRLSIGIHGSGLYFSTDKNAARTSAEDKNSVMTTAYLTSDAHGVSSSQIRERMFTSSQKWSKKFDAQLEATRSIKNKEEYLRVSALISLNPHERQDDGFLVRAERHPVWPPFSFDFVKLTLQSHAPHNGLFLLTSTVAASSRAQVGLA